MTFFAIDRFLFLFYNLNELNLSFIQKIEPFWQAFRLDLSTACYMIFPLFIIWLIGLFIPIKKIEKIIKIYFLTLIPLLAFGVILNLEIYSEWGHQVNRDTFSYLKYPREAWASSLNSPLMLLFSLFGVYTFLFLKWGNYISRLDWRMFKWASGLNRKRILINLVKGLLAFIIFGIFLRGGLQLAPINQSFAYYSNNPTLNAAAVNTVYNYLYGFTREAHINPYKYFSEKEIEKLLYQDYSKLSNAPKIFSKPEPNVVLIIIEGFSAELFKSMGGKNQLTPNMDKLIENGLLFDNIYATSTRTDRGLVSILSGYPSLPNISLVKQPEKAAKLSFLSQHFKNLGFTTNFLYGGESEFANIKSYLLNAGFNQIIDKNNFNSKDFNSKWGAHDHIVFNRALKELKKLKEPFFSTILTLSSHEPFEVPMETIIQGSDRQSLYKNSVLYTDKTIGNFMKEIQKEMYYKNTIFVFISDHGFRIGNATNREKRRYHIPLFMYGIPLKEQWSGKKISNVGSQSDLAKTILGQFNIKTNSFKFSNDLFTNQSGNAQYTFSHGFGFVSSKQSLIYDYNTEVVTYSNSKETTSNQQRFFNTGKAYLQKAYQDFIDRK